MEKFQNGPEGTSLENEGKKETKKEVKKLRRDFNIVGAAMGAAGLVLGGSVMKKVESVSAITDDTLMADGGEFFEDYLDRQHHGRVGAAEAESLTEFDSKKLDKTALEELKKQYPYEVSFGDDKISIDEEKRDSLYLTYITAQIADEARMINVERTVLESAGLLADEAVAGDLKKRARECLENLDTLEKAVGTSSAAREIFNTFFIRPPKGGDKSLKELLLEAAEQREA